MPKTNDDLFARASEAASKVITLQGEIAVRRVELKKARTEAVALKRQVMDALKGVRKPRTRKAKAPLPPVEDGPPAGFGQINDTPEDNANG